MSSSSGERKKRKGKREQLPARFAAVDAAFDGCDRLIVQFRGQAATPPPPAPAPSPTPTLPAKALITGFTA